MADDETRRGDGGDAAPGIPFMNSFNVMEDVLDKLKLLDYETSFCKEWGFKSFPRYLPNNFSCMHNFLVQKMIAFSICNLWEKENCKEQKVIQEKFKNKMNKNHFSLQWS